MSKKKTWSAMEVEKLNYLRLDKKLSWEEIAAEFQGLTPNGARKAFYRYMKTDAKPKTGPKILAIDIETKPMIALVWGLYDQNVGLDMILEDWSILSFSAKWLGAPESEIFYHDTRSEDNPSNDEKLVSAIHSLLEEADAVLVQNGARFDVPKINARFVHYGMQPPSSYKIIDTLKIAKKHFGFTSNKLAYMTDKFCKKYKKLDHHEFTGVSLWKECMKGNLKAWKVMEKYNKYDILSMEELYVDVLAKWDSTFSVEAYYDDLINRCTCGNSEFIESGFHYTKKGKYQRYKCTACGKEHRDSTNLLSKEKRKSIRV